MQKFREQEDIRRETDRIGFERKQQVVDEARRESLVEQLTGVLSQAGGVGLDVDKVYAGGLDAFSNDDLTASIAGIGGAVAAKQQQAADIASRQEMEFEGLQEARRQAESGSLIESRGASAEASRALAEERRRPDEEKSSTDIYKQSQMIDDISNQFNKTPMTRTVSPRENWRKRERGHGRPPRNTSVGSASTSPTRKVRKSRSPVPALGQWAWTARHLTN
jgi:hypothetical protein